MLNTYPVNNPQNFNIASPRLESNEIGIGSDEGDASAENGTVSNDLPIKTAENVQWEWAQQLLLADPNQDQNQDQNQNKLEDQK